MSICFHLSLSVSLSVLSVRAIPRINARLEARFGVRYDSVLVNLYPDGATSPPELYPNGSPRLTALAPSKSLWACVLL
jgi:hypothetical protein